jgi:hypothetical protein
MTDPNSDAEIARRSGIPQTMKFLDRSEVMSVATLAFGGHVIARAMLDTGNKFLQAIEQRETCCLTCQAVVLNDAQTAGVVMSWNAGEEENGPALAFGVCQHCYSKIDQTPEGWRRQYELWAKAIHPAARLLPVPVADVGHA